MSNEVHRIMSFLCSMAAATSTTDRKTAKEILMSETLFCNGELREIKVKHLGVGVYKVFTVPFKHKKD